jgi:hypothetical protein
MSYEGPSIVTTAPEYTGPRVLSYPFASDGDLTHVVAQQQYIVKTESYVAPALDTTITIGATTLYLVGDFNQSLIDSGCIEFTRQWASIPALRTRPIGSYAYAYPGLQLFSAGAIKTVTAVTFGTTFATLTSTAHGFLNSDYVLIIINYTSNSVAKTFAGCARVFNVTANTFEVWFPANVAPNVFTNGTARTYTPQRGQTTIIGNALAQYEYVLPGVTSGIPDAQSYRELDTFRAIEATSGAIEDTVGVNTLPTLVNYIDLIRNRSLLVAESSVKTYLGNIIERRTVFVTAQ